ncbi:MAG: hypothetical protein ABL956_14795 [Hyphomonadaceae bacterium]
MRIGLLVDVFSVEVFNAGVAQRVELGGMVVVQMQTRKPSQPRRPRRLTHTSSK